MLTDLQITDLAEKMNIPLADVCFKDQLPKKLEVNKVYIINLQDSITDDGDENGGTHWTMLEVCQTPDKSFHPFFFDPYGIEPSEIIKNLVMKNFKKHLPYSKKDIQSLMNNACGFYCLALAHYVNSFKHRTGYFYDDIDNFLEMFDDLNKSIDWKKNEYILKHFFQSEDPNKRRKIDVVSQTHDDYERIVNEDSGRGIDLTKIPVNINYINK